MIQPTDRNALGEAYLQATAALDAACDIKELLDIWSARQPLHVPPRAQAELRNIFRDAHRQLSQAEQKFEQVLSEQIERRLLDNDTNGAAHGSSFRRQRNGSGAL